MSDIEGKVTRAGASGARAANEFQNSDWAEQFFGGQGATGGVFSGGAAGAVSMVRKG